MRKIRFAVCVVVLFFGALLFAVPASFAAKFGEEDFSVLSNYTQILYDYENGLPTNGANDVLQTSDGYIWVAGYNGLIRYDGDKFVVFSPKNTPGFTSKAILTLFEDSQKRLWIGTNDKGVMVYQNREFIPVELGNISVHKFAETKNGEILVGAKEGLFRIPAKTDLKGDLPTIEQRISVEDMLVDSAGRLWLISSAGKLIPPAISDLTLDLNIKYSSIFEDSRKNIYLSCQEGTAEGNIIMLEKSGKNYTPFVIETGLYRIHDYAETTEGNIWVCSDAGIGYVRGKDFYYAGGLVLYSSLEAIMQDYEGSIWIASSRNGLLQLIEQKVADLSFAGQLGANIVNSAAEFNGNIYVGTDNKLQILNSDYKQVHNELTKMLSVVRIRAITTDSKGYLWIGEYEDYGLVRYSKNGEIVSINTKNSNITSNKVRVIKELQSGEMAVGTSNGVNIVNGTKVVKTYTAADGLVTPVVLALVQDKNGRLIIGTDGGGLFSIENGTITPFSVGKLDSHVVLRLHYDEASDSLWVATNSSLYCYQFSSGSLQQLGYVTEHLNSVFDIVTDKLGRLWLLGSDGIVVGTQEEIVSGKNVTVLAQKDGLPYQTTPNSWSSLTSRGSIFLCGTKGLGLIDVNDYTAKEAAPMLTIEQITADADDVAIGELVNISKDVKRLTFQVVTPYFSPKSKIQVEYKLGEFDDGWQVQPATNGGGITYTNLKGGEYVFYVKASNSEGVYGPEQKIRLIKEYKFLERPWVIPFLILLSFLVMLLIGLLIMRARTQKILKRQREYKRITDQAISTISKAIDAKDTYTEGHSIRVAQYSVEVGRRMGLSDDELEKLQYIALLHDIGKIGISDNILNKPGRLTDEEFKVMRSHSSIGGEILKHFTAIENIEEGASSHHEKYDGSGYPLGLKGSEISLTSRIIGVCDTYDAMATRRSYKDPMDNEYMINELRRCSGTQFDPEIAEVMIKMIEEGFHLEEKPAKDTTEE